VFVKAAIYNTSVACKKTYPAIALSKHYPIKPIVSASKRYPVIPLVPESWLHIQHGFSSFSFVYLASHEPLSPIQTIF
jgi:hypothetical protein